MDMQNDLGTPRVEVVNELFARSRPRLEDLFRRHWISEDEAEEILDEALVSLLVRWDRIGDPEPRLLGVVERAILHRLALTFPVVKDSE
jgi:DNA-directed RNA polymerase specialized sigma24 family protein